MYQTVLAEIQQVNSLGTVTYYEVVQMNIVDSTFESFHGSDTFEDGEIVKKYVPIEQIKNRFIVCWEMITYYNEIWENEEINLDELEIDGQPKNLYLYNNGLVVEIFNFKFIFEGHGNCNVEFLVMNDFKLPKRFQICSDEMQVLFDFQTHNINSKVEYFGKIFKYKYNLQVWFIPVTKRFYID